ncbi:MAG TPA: hypothetical protein VGM53_08055 [Streptosporangiaceae bacterium]
MGDGAGDGLIVQGPVCDGLGCGDELTVGWPGEGVGWCGRVEPGAVLGPAGTAGIGIGDPGSRDDWAGPAE